MSENKLLKTKSNRLNNNGDTQLPQSLQHLVNHHQITGKIITKYVFNSMDKLFSMNKQIIYETSKDLVNQCTNCDCNENDIDTYNNCRSVERILIIIAAYIIIKKHNIFEDVSLTEALRFKDIYTTTQIQNDFFHIKDHIDKNNQLSIKMTEELGITNSHCTSRRLTTEQNNKPSDKHDMVVGDLCEKILAYLTTVYPIISIDGTEEQIPNNKKRIYSGKTEDNNWWNDENIESDDIYYHKLVQRGGIFQWQTGHGFNSKQHQGLMHLTPKYKHVKEEALYNPYYPLSKDNWNQTLRKSQVFFNSYARQRIKSMSDGQYNDEITNTLIQWNEGETIDTEGILILKLYTDFDKLRCELEKCLTFEIATDICNENYSQNCYVNRKMRLEFRLQVFYFWRIKLSVVINKYSQPLESNVTLYHGVNSKKIINNKRLHRFYGPLLATTSLHVAETFATSKGMVLELSTYFPGLNFCRAFDAALLSDYPEEKEWIIATIYLRIINVTTRPFRKNVKAITEMDNDALLDVPLASKARSIFLAIHLFEQQIFSMSVYLEYWLSAFLYIHCDYDELFDNKDNGKIKKTDFVNTLNKCRNYSGRYHRILSILRNKFDNFRKYPNHKQVIKIDRISTNLKVYFMDYIGLDIYKNPKYVISITKIVKIFENVKEIHFINPQMFDNTILWNVVHYLEEHSETNLSIIKFVYYKDKQLNENKQLFINFQQLKQILLDSLEKRKWCLMLKTNQTCDEINFYSFRSYPDFRRQVSMIRHVERWLQNGEYMTNVIRTTKWDIVDVYNGIGNETQLELTTHKKTFIKELDNCMKNTKHDTHYQVIPILMENKHDTHYHVEFVQLITSEIIYFQLGVSYAYDGQNNELNIVGIHLNKHFMVTQHHLLIENKQCGSLANFKPNVVGLKSEMTLNRKTELLLVHEQSLHEMQNKIDNEKRLLEKEKTQLIEAQKILNKQLGKQNQRIFQNYMSQLDHKENCIDISVMSVIQAKENKIIYTKQYSCFYVPLQLIKKIQTVIKEHIYGLYDHIIKTIKLNANNIFQNRKKMTIIVIDCGFHHKITNKVLYVVGEEYCSNEYEWKMMLKPFTANDIISKFSLNFELPKLYTLCPKYVNTQKQKILSFIQQQNDIKKIEKTKWKKLRNKIHIYNKDENSRRITVGLSKKEFLKEVKQFRNTAVNTNNLIVILMPNKNDDGHHIEFVEFVRIAILEESSVIITDIGLSHRYIEKKNAVHLVGVHLDKHFVQIQHEIAICAMLQTNKRSHCKCLQNDKCTQEIMSNIDVLTIGDPNYDKNTLHRYKMDMNTKNN